MFYVDWELKGGKSYFLSKKLLIFNVGLQETNNFFFGLGLIFLETVIPTNHDKLKVIIWSEKQREVTMIKFLSILK